MALTKIKSAGIADDAITADKLPTTLDLIDNQKIRFGTDNDLEVFHNGNHGFIANSTGQLQIKGDHIELLGNTAAEYLIRAIKDGATELYFDNSKKIETSSSGVRMPDATQFELGDGSDLKMWHSGSDSFIRNETGNLTIEANGAGEDAIKIIPDGAVELFHNGSKKFETNSEGVQIHGKTYCEGDVDVADNSKFLIGNNDDLEIFHDGTNSKILNSGGQLQIIAAGAGDLVLQAKNGESSIVAKEDAQVDLYYDGSKKAYTYSEGLKVDGYIKALADLSDAHNGDNTGDYHCIQSSNESNSTLLLEHSGNSTPRGIYMYFSDAAPDNATQYFLYCEDNSSSIRAKINSNGAFESADNSYGGISDIKLKENIVDAKSQWNDVKALKIRNFNFKRKPDTKLLGVVAQEVETISPGIVYESEDLEKGGASKGTTTKGVKYSILYMKAIKALQEAMARIETLETKVAILETK